MEKRVVIVDFNHMAHNFWHSPVNLGINITENGETYYKSTKIQNGTIKNIYNWTRGGSFPCAVCFDRPVPARKAFFQSKFSDMAVGTDKEYKGGREKMPQDMFDAIADTEKILRIAGVPCFAEHNYEADDMIYACVKRAKEKYPGMPIDIVSNDADLLPLVDDTVSLFLRSKKGTYAENKSIEKAKYIQVTPRNFTDVVSGLSAFKGFYLPYNSILLYKLLRGDSSDNYKRKDISALFPPKKFSTMMFEMEENGVDISSIFRYADPQYKILYRGTNVEFRGTIEEALASPDVKQLYRKVYNPVELDKILDVLQEYAPKLTPEMLSHIESTYWGMNLNQPYPNKEKLLSRKAYVVGRGSQDIGQYSESSLRSAANTLQIKLPVN